MPPNTPRESAMPDAIARRFGVSRETCARLEVYAGLLRQWQTIKNLVSPSTLDVLWERHIADSLQLLALAPDAKVWLDLGSGAGFPGMVIAIALMDPVFASAARPAGWDERSQAQNPECESWASAVKAASAQPTGQPTALVAESDDSRRQSARPRKPLVHLVESNARKCAFLGEVARRTGAPVEIHGGRIELLVEKRRIESVEVVTARALAPLGKLLGYAHPFLSAGTRCLFLKGRDVDREIEEARGHWQFDVRLVPSQTDEHGRIAVLTSVKPIHKE